MPLCIAFFLCPEVWPKEQAQKQMNHWLWPWPMTPNQKEFSEVAGKVWQNSGILISSLFCRREKILGGFPLWFLGFFTLTSKSSGLSVPPSLMVCQNWESSSQESRQHCPSMPLSEPTTGKETCKEKKTATQKASKSYSRHASKEGEPIMHKKNSGLRIRW